MVLVDSQTSYLIPNEGSNVADGGEKTSVSATSGDTNGANWEPLIHPHLTPDGLSRTKCYLSPPDRT